MISLRYHIVSLVAVFLALALGIVVGSTVLQEGTVSVLRATSDRVREESDRNSRETEPRGSRQPNHRCNLEETDMTSLDLRGLVPAPVTPFTRDGEVDHDAIQRLGSWLGSFDGVKGLVVLGHAGEGTLQLREGQTAAVAAGARPA